MGKGGKGGGEKGGGGGWGVIRGEIQYIQKQAFADFL